MNEECLRRSIDRTLVCFLLWNKLRDYWLSYQPWNFAFLLAVVLSVNLDLMHLAKHMKDSWL